MFKIQQAGVATLNEIIASSNEINKKINNLQSSQNKMKDNLTPAMKHVKDKVTEIVKFQSGFRLSVNQIEIDVAGLKLQNEFLKSKIDEIKTGQVEVKNLVDLKSKELESQAKSIAEALKSQNTEIMKNSNLTSKFDNLQDSVAQLSQIQNKTAEMIANLQSDQEIIKISQNSTQDTIQQLQYQLTTTAEKLDDIKATQATIMSSIDLIQQSIAPQVTETSETTLSPEYTEDTTNLQKFETIEEKISKKLEQDIKDAEERMMTKFEKILEEKLNEILDKKLEKLISGQIGGD
jgi:chromosome segregation ATPase